MRSSSTKGPPGETRLRRKRSCTKKSLHFTKTAELCAAITTAHREAAKRLKSDITDEMAVPSYLKGDPFSRWNFWGRLRHVVRQARFRPALRSSTSAAGLACCSRLAAEGRTVYGTDLHLDIARRLVAELKLPRVELLAADRWQETVPDGQIDTIIAADVLEHIEQRQELLANLGRKLAPGGRLVICGPTENWMYKLGRRIVGFSGHYHVTAIAQMLSRRPRGGLHRSRIKKLPAARPVVPIQDRRVHALVLPCLLFAEHLQQPLADRFQAGLVLDLVVLLVGDVEHVQHLVEIAC